LSPRRNLSDTFSTEVYEGESLNIDVLFESNHDGSKYNIKAWTGVLIESIKVPVRTKKGIRNN
jgi:hypothetical protein